MHWGKYQETALWTAPVSRWKLLIGGDDRLIYIAAGRLRLRIMKS